MEDDRRQGEQRTVGGTAAMRVDTRSATARASRPSLAEVDRELDALAQTAGDRASRPSLVGRRRSLVELEADLDRLSGEVEVARASRPQPPVIATLPSVRPLSLPPVPADHVGLPAVLSLLGSDGEMRSAITPPPMAPDTEPPAAAPALAMREPTPVPEVAPEAEPYEASFTPIPQAPRMPRADVTASLLAADLPDLDLGEMSEPAANVLVSTATELEPELDLPPLVLEDPGDRAGRR